MRNHSYLLSLGLVFCLCHQIFMGSSCLCPTDIGQLMNYTSRQQIQPLWLLPSIP